MWILDDRFEESLPLPSGERDLALMIADRSFDRHNQLTDPFTAARGERVELRSGPRHGARQSPGARPYEGALMQFRVDARLG